MNIDLSKVQRHLEWLKTKLYLDEISSSAKSRVIKRGEVYWCNLGEGIGSEESKRRPCVILQTNIANKKSSNTLVAPITHTTSTVPVVVSIKDKYDSSGNLLLDGNVLIGNMVCVNKARLDDFIVKLDNDEIKEIDKAIAIETDIKKYYDKLNNKYKDQKVYIDKLKEKISLLEREIEELKKDDK